MPSTYSTNLGLELIATGDQTGTWGITTNTNLGTLIEQAVVGMGAISFTSDADKTITITNGATSATRCAYLNVTSSVSLTATRNLIVPTTQKNYMVFNGTTGGQSIQVKTVAGTGVTILTGRTSLVQVDGTNVIQQFDYVPTLRTTTQSASDNSTKAATTAYVDTAVGAVTGVPSGVMSPFAGSAAPAGWLLCYGQAVSRATYSSLFTAISTVYGIGDGSTTFNLPDLRGRSIFGQDNMGGSAANRVTNANSGITGTTLGATGGTELFYQHNHTISGSTDSGGTHTHTFPMTDTPFGGGTFPVTTGYGIDNNVTGTTSSGGAHTHTISGSVTNSGTGASQNMTPTIIMNYIIKT